MVAIQKLTPADFERVARWLSNPEINRWLTSEWRNREVTGVALAMLLRNQRNALFLVTEEGQPCGLVAFSEIDTADKTANLWYILGEEHLSGKGITTQAVRQLAGLGFGPMGLASITAWAMDDNIPSQKVLKKAGFKEVGRFRRSAASGGRQVDRVYFDLVPEDLKP